MIGLDTNVVVRYLMQDDPRQSRRATQVIEALTVDEPAFLPIVTIVELVWVLESSYELTRTQVAQALAGLLDSRELRVTQPGQQILDRFGHLGRLACHLAVIGQGRVEE